MAYINQAWLMGQLPLLALQPEGIWGISYDVFTRPTEDDVPNGWQAGRCMCSFGLVTSHFP